MLFRTIAGIMTALFIVAVAVQYNDPDPVRWMALYGAAALVSIVAATRGSAPFGAPLAVGVVAVVWGVFWAITNRLPPDVYRHMFDAWEMKSEPIEEAREASGLLIVAVWMAVVARRTRRLLKETR